MRFVSRREKLERTWRMATESAPDKHFAASAAAPPKLDNERFHVGDDNDDVNPDEMYLDLGGGD